MNRGARRETKESHPKKKVIAPTICPTEEKKNETKGNIPEKEGKKKEEQIPLVLFPSSSSLLLKYIRKRVEFWSKEKKKRSKVGPDVEKRSPPTGFLNGGGYERK